jgi:hypothetical protein
MGLGGKGGPKTIAARGITDAFPRTTGSTPFTSGSWISTVLIKTSCLPLLKCPHTGSCRRRLQLAHLQGHLRPTPIKGKWRTSRLFVIEITELPLG